MSVSMPALAAPAAEFRATDPARRVFFALRADAEPGVLPRILELFAKRGLVPMAVSSRLTVEADALTVEVEVAGLVRAESDHIAHCLRGLPTVSQVLTSESCGQ